METSLKLRLLGRPVFEAEGRELACNAQKAVWLAAYVFLTKVAQPRPRLAALLWGGAGQRHALGSLRVALTKLPAPVLKHLSVTRDTVAPTPGVDVDVETFTALASSDEVESLRSAVALYRGDLLQDIGQDLAPEFADWLFAERNRLRTIAADAHVKLARRLHSLGERDRAREVADAWLRLDPANEAMHRLLMTWLSQGAGGDQALAHYEVYRRARAVAHGAAPSEEMSSLAERLRQGAGAAPREMPPRIGAATSFFGRTDELAELRGLLADPTCRLLTLLGMGGVGKTRLSMALAEMEGPAFPDGTYVVGLDDLQDPRLFAQTLARACGLQPAASASPLSTVCGFLRERNALVVLDNLEHLVGEPGDPHGLAAQIATLLRETGSQLKVLATSRETLHLQEEWSYELSGLAYPASDAVDDAQNYPAVQFFAQRARQAYVGFSLAAELPNVVKVCEALEGLPLGLELAASWVRNVPCAEIASSLRERAQELRSRHVNRAARHQTLGAVVAYSWERLPAEQREALSGLGALHGSFSREAAEHVAQASLRTLTALTEKSLLSRVSAGRWHQHEVVRQYAWDQHGTTAKARAVRQASVLKRRDSFYLEFLRNAQARLDGPEESEGLAEIEAESANIRRAWESGAASASVGALDAAAPTWFDFLECRTYTAEGLRAAEAWLDAAHRAGDGASATRAMIRRGVFLRFSGDNPGSLAALDEALAAMEGLDDAKPDRSQAHAGKSFTLFLMGRLEEAERSGAESLALAEAIGDKALIASACRVRGLALVQLGRREEGRDIERRSLEAATSLGKPSMVAAAHNNLALAENHLGNYASAEAGYESALDLWRLAGNTLNVGRAMHNLGAVATRKGDYAQALDRYQAALEHLRRAGDRNLIALNLMSQGDAMVRIGRPRDAMAPLEQALMMAEHDGNMLPALDARIVLAQAALALGDRPSATYHLVAAFEGGKRHHFTNVLADAVIVAARMLVELGPPERERAFGWAHAVAQLPGVSVTVRRDALALEAELSPAFSAAVRAAAKKRDLSELVTEARGALAEA
ncbi:hypothetical protein DSM104443_02733 [Usitatibacter rugosus]|uniref:Bacterial transcriptional activator domain-containing protein n=1 Tax=Usitatibacter rugosus TaxID=2732067 RepID=A0A6M4GYR9_9PROT|nr:tetratricopeptide repeat protein [Usitatibacter rugosus]QJR11654.1 hypothetical protein DSM104443_02733 [Usitatibacter rugosus]